MRDVAARGDFRDVFQDEDAMSGFRGGRSGGKNPGSACALFLCLSLTGGGEEGSDKPLKVWRNFESTGSFRFRWGLAPGGCNRCCRRLSRHSRSSKRPSSSPQWQCQWSNFRARLSQKVDSSKSTLRLQPPVEGGRGKLFVGVPVCATSGDGLPEPTFV